MNQQKRLAKIRVFSVGSKKTFLGMLLIRASNKKLSNYTSQIFVILCENSNFLCEEIVSHFVFKLALMTKLYKALKLVFILWPWEIA